MLENLKIRSGYDGFLYLVETTRNPPRLESHHHRELELNLVLRGKVTYVISGRRFCFGPRSLLWIFPAQEHQLVDLSDDAQNYVAVFTPGLIARSCESELYAGLKGGRSRREGVLHTALEPDTFDLIRRTMDSLMRGALDGDVLNREAGFGVKSNFTYEHSDVDGLNAGLHHLLLLCWRSQSTGRALGEPVVLHPAVSRALKLLTEAEGCRGLAALASACGVSGPYLSRIFGRQIGTPLSRYRNSLRLARFWQEYRQPEKRTLAEAVYAAGFGSYAQFHKVFTRAYGRGPRASLATGREER